MGRFEYTFSGLEEAQYPDAISSFSGKYRFLSNFYPAPFEYRNYLWPTVEHAYQACKLGTLDTPEAETIRTLPTAQQAKFYGKTCVRLPQSWYSCRLGLMRNLVGLKFAQNEYLQDLLLATSGNYLVEGNTWGDTFWGVDLTTGVGLNNLGRILMDVRGGLELRKAGETLTSQGYI